MTGALDHIGRNQHSPAAVAERVSQATAVEQARAVAEVQAAIVVAQQVPRDMQHARQQMLDSCSQMYLAERAFFRYNRAGSQITGPSIHLARELARCFGNMQYGLTELSRDDERGWSQMLAWAWDVQNNTRPTTTFLVPHGRDTKQDGRKQLTELRDIYENNANQGARRVREQIFAVLPPWFTEEAKATCRKTLEGGGGEPLAVRIDKMIEAFRALGVTDKQLVDRLARKADHWTPGDIAVLGVVYTSIKNGEATVEEEFPPVRVTGAEIIGGVGVTPGVVAAAVPLPAATEPTTEATTPAAPAAGQAAPAPPDPPAEGAKDPGPPASRSLITSLLAGLDALGYKTKEDKIGLLSKELGRSIALPTELTKPEAETLIEKIKQGEITPPPAPEPGDDWVEEPPADWQPEDGAQ
jgi:hypothetical protein